MCKVGMQTKKKEHAVGILKTIYLFLDPNKLLLHIYADLIINKCAKQQTDVKWSNVIIHKISICQAKHSGHCLIQIHVIGHPSLEKLQMLLSRLPHMWSILLFLAKMRFFTLRIFHVCDA